VKWIPASARSARFVIELNQVAFHVLYLDPISNYNSAKVASPTIHIDQKRREVVQDHPSYLIQLFSKRCDRYSPQESSST
jgi:predicted metallopeptidase